MKLRKLIRVIECKKCGVCKKVLSIFEANDNKENYVLVSEKYNFWVPKEEIKIIEEKIKCNKGHIMKIDSCISTWI